MSITSPSLCFRLGDLYRDMDSGIGIAMHGLEEMDLPELGQAFYRIGSRAAMIQGEFFPNEESLSEIIEASNLMNDIIREAMTQGRKRLLKRDAEIIEDGIRMLLDLVETDFFRVAHAECRG